MNFMFDLIMTMFYDGRPQGFYDSSLEKDKVRFAWLYK